MKKTLIALALVSLPVAASAEVILYGNIRGGVEFTREGTSAQTKSQRNSWGVVDYGSYIGFKGSEDLGGNLKAIWQVEANTSLDGDSFVNNRDTFVGLEGGFGTVKLGRVSTPLKQALDAQDNWEYDSRVLGLGYYGRFGQRRTSLNYQSPDFGGFNFAFQMAPGSNVHDGSRTDDGKPVFGLGLGYKNSGFFARYAVEYARKSTPAAGGLKDSHVHNLSAGYDANKVTVAYGRADSDNTAHDGGRYLQAIVGADYAFSRRTTGLVSVGWLREKANSNDKNVNNWGVGTGVVHKF